MENITNSMRRLLRHQPVFSSSKLLTKQFEPLQRIKTIDLLLNPSNSESVTWHIDNLVTKWRYDRPDPTRKNRLLFQALLATRQFLYQAVGEVQYANLNLLSKHRVPSSHTTSHGSLRYTIYFLYASAYLGIRPTAAIEYFELSRSKTRQLAQLLARILQGISFTPNAAPNAPAHELAILQRATEGFEKGQLKVSYELIEALERGSRGIYIAFPASGILQLLAAASYGQFLQTLQRQISPYSIALYLESQPLNLLERLIHDETVRYPWLLVELLRRLVATERRNEAAPSSIQTGIRLLINRLQEVDDPFFQQAVEYFSYSQEVNNALGGQLASWPVANALALLQNKLGIDRYNHAQQQRSGLLRAYSTYVNHQQLTEFLAGVFAIWERYLEEFGHNRSEALFDVLQTDYWDYVINYYRFTQDETKLVASLWNMYEQIRWLNTEWHIDTTQFIKAFHLKFTKLFAISCAYRLMEFNNSSAKQLADTIEKDLTFATVDRRNTDIYFGELIANLRG
jgi:hypothetical protein